MKEIEYPCVALNGVSCLGGYIFRPRWQGYARAQEQQVHGPRTYMHWTAVSGFKAARVAQQGQPSTRCISYFRLSASCRQFRS